MISATVSDYYIQGDAIFYKLSHKLDMAPILLHRLNKSESKDQAIERWKTEQHWLADWSSAEPFEGYKSGCEVEFEMSSSTFYRAIYHGNERLSDVRNINTTKIRLI